MSIAMICACGPNDNNDSEQENIPTKSLQHVTNNKKIKSPTTTSHQTQSKDDEENDQIYENFPTDLSELEARKEILKHTKFEFSQNVKVLDGYSLEDMMEGFNVVLVIDEDTDEISFKINHNYDPRYIEPSCSVFYKTGQKEEDRGAGFLSSTFCSCDSGNKTFRLKVNKEKVDYSVKVLCRLRNKQGDEINLPLINIVYNGSEAHEAFIIMREEYLKQEYKKSHPIEIKMFKSQEMFPQFRSIEDLSNAIVDNIQEDFFSWHQLYYFIVVISNSEKIENVEVKWLLDSSKLGNITLTADSYKLKYEVDGLKVISLSCHNGLPHDLLDLPEKIEEMLKENPIEVRVSVNNQKYVKNFPVKF